MYCIYLQEPLRISIRAAEEAYVLAQQVEQDAASALDDWTNAQVRNTAAAIAGRSRRENNAKHDYSVLSGKSAVHPRKTELLDDLKTAQQDTVDKGNEVKRAKDILASFYNNHCVTFEDFRAHGVKVSAPIADEYKRLFLSPSGDYYQVMKAYMAARSLNPLVAGRMSDLELREAILDLGAYGLDEFRPTALQDLIAELPTYRGAINSTPKNFWSEVDGAEKYDRDLKRKIEDNPDKYDADLTWEDDRIEQSCRVWEWWRVMGKKFNYFFTAARLVAIVPLSSASVERVFSQVKYIIETTGECVLEETLEARVMERVNDYSGSSNG